METIPTTLMTASEFFDWSHRPENRDRHFELDRGRVVEMSRPGEQHCFICANIARILGNYTFQRRQGYVLSNDVGIIWENDPDTVKGPDIVFYAKNRSLAELNPKYSEEVPALAVEVLSPNDRLTKVLHRIKQFLRWGVPQVWLADPEERTISVFCKDRELEVLAAGQDLLGYDILPDFRCRVADFFYMPGEESPPAQQ